VTEPALGHNRKRMRQHKGKKRVGKYPLLEKKGKPSKNGWRVGGEERVSRFPCREKGEKERESQGGMRNGARTSRV